MDLQLGSEKWQDLYSGFRTSKLSSCLANMAQLVKHHPTHEGCWVQSPGGEATNQC